MPFPWKRALLPSLIFSSLFLLIIVLLLHHRTVIPDMDLSELLSGLPSSVYLFFSILCRSGNVEIELPILLILGRLIWRRRRDARSELLFFLIVLILGTLFEHFLKMNLPRYSPTETFQHDPLTGWEIFFPAHFHVVSSFPSGHTFRALLILLFTDRYFPELRLFVLVWASLIMVGVVALGWHWSSDVFGSACLVLAIRPWFEAMGQKIKKS